jgi:hypothetical protein
MTDRRGMSDYAPMKCAYCEAGPYSGPLPPDDINDPTARFRVYDCEKHVDGDLHIWQPTEQCANRALQQKESLRTALYTAMDILFQGDDPSNERIALIETAAPEYEPGWQYEEDDE